jgi:hypothetical protein
MKRHRTKDHEKDRNERWGWARFRARRSATAEPDLEPDHDQPWVPTNGLADRKRRSPRQ